MRTRIMYIENKATGLTGPCRIGLVRFSKTGATLYYGDRAFKSLTGSGFKANYFDQVSGEHFWISGPRRDGADGLYGRITQPENVDADVAEPYWRDIRGLGSAPVATTGRVGASLEPDADDRLPYENRDLVEHPRPADDATPSIGRGRKATRIERRLRTLSPQTEPR
ncbi:hypothetical protein [Phenylobacterium montanum]|uniref:1-deoxy-D-xylulose-5-phosphate synthase n=1 Tax=Phenylobacterium montanum TaxID=2823693 RepID=A0A975IUG7_9CAUL|nr:hypothetical protein [Caulobacter sp. S6]QUD87509.1 hypothetical protein KCG34_21025 [Caulobacter sp. S6]